MDLTLIPLKSNLLQNWKFLEVQAKIIQRLTDLRLNDAKYKNDSEFLMLVCNMIENLIFKKDKIIKKEMAISIFSTLFGLTPDEETLISNNIQFIHTNGMIRRVSQYKLFKVGLKELFWKKT